MEEFDFELLKEELLTRPIEGKIDKKNGQLYHRNTAAGLWLRNVSSNLGSSNEKVVSTVQHMDCHDDRFDLGRAHHLVNKN